MRELVGRTLLDPSYTKSEKKLQQLGRYVSLPWADWVRNKGPESRGFVAVLPGFEYVTAEELLRFADMLAAEPREIGVDAITTPDVYGIGGEAAEWSENSWYAGKALEAFWPWHSKRRHINNRDQMINQRGWSGATWMIVIFPADVIEWGD